MSRAGVRRALTRGTAAGILLCCAGWLAAQRGYRDILLPPESPWSVHEPPGSGRPSEFVLARMAYTDR